MCLSASSGFFVNCTMATRVSAIPPISAPTTSAILAPSAPSGWCNAAAAQSRLSICRLCAGPPTQGALAKTYRAGVASRCGKRTRSTAHRRRKRATRKTGACLFERSGSARFRSQGIHVLSVQRRRSAAAASAACLLMWRTPPHRWRRRWRRGGCCCGGCCCGAGWTPRGLAHSGHVVTYSEYTNVYTCTTAPQARFRLAECHAALH